MGRLYGKERASRYDEKYAVHRAACAGPKSNISTGLRYLPLSRCASSLGTLVTAYVAREALGVLQARDAQMDERALKAPQEGAGKGGRGSRTGPAAAGVLQYRTGDTIAFHRSEPDSYG